MLSTIIAYVEQHEPFFVVSLTLGIFLSGVASAAIAVCLAIENRKIRKAGTEPDVIGYLLQDKLEPQLVQFHMVNVGRGPAFDVALHVEADAETLKQQGVYLPAEGDRPPLSALPQDESLTVLFGVGHELMKEPKAQPVRGHITFKNAMGKKMRRSFCVDIDQLGGFMRAKGKSPEEKIATSLSEIEREIKYLGNGFKRLQVSLTSNAYDEEEVEHS